MAMVDPFTPSAFQLTELTASINNLKYRPSRLSGFFEERGVAALSVVVEEQNGVLSILETRPRGAPGQPMGRDDRKVRSFAIPHIPVQGQILADEVQGVRAFGSENSSDVLAMRLSEKLQFMRDSLDYTLESHRLQAIMGNYIDVNGDAQSLFTAFGVNQQTQALGLHATNRSQIRQKMFAVNGKVATALDGTPYSGMTVLCGDNFWSALLDDADTRNTYLNQAQAADLRGNPSDRFTAFGAMWEWYRGTTAANLGSDAYVIPAGVPGLCITRFAPANYVETVNTMGLPLYAKSEPLPLGKGYRLEAQSNPLNLVTRPAAMIKLTIS